MSEPKKPTKDQVKAALDAVRAVADAVRELGSVPSGVLYTRLMPYMGYEAYCSVVAMLKRTGLVAEDMNVLRWTGPHPEGKP